jgi:prepilin-type N-terminal cleavage/methylation domain-containing protein
MQRTTPRHAFTLVELSIVLVIIGLIIGGVLSGRSLVSAGKLRTVAADAEAYMAAANNFRNQYRYLPGDMPNAASYWSTTGNGDADGQVAGTERFRFWQQINLAGFVNSSFTGATGGGGANDFVIGSNIPNSRIDRAGFSFYYANLTATTTVYTMNLGNMLAFGRSGGTNTGEPINAALTPTDAFNVDTKADDGQPATGKWIANGTGGGNFGTATACTTSSSGTDYSGTYQRTSDTESCGFFIMSGI